MFKNLGRLQKDGIARVLDGFIIAASIAVASSVTGRAGFSPVEYLGLGVVISCSVTIALVLRRE